MTYCVDIDGTILYTELVDEEYILSGYNHKLIEKLNRLHADGNIIILHTGRHWKHLIKTKEQLSSGNVRYDTLVHGKPPADVYIDDRAVRPDEF